MKIFKTCQIKEIDALTIKNTPIGSYPLMKRAARAFFEKLLPKLSSEKQICVVAGSGNNGGDALVVASLIKKVGITPITYFIPSNSISSDCQEALAELQNLNVQPSIVRGINELKIPKDSILIDGLFGSGLNRPLEGVFAQIVKKINESETTVYAIDIPSGLFGEDNKHNNLESIVKADYTFTFQTPKLSFFQSEYEQYIGKFEILNIGLLPDALEQTPSSFYLTEIKDIQKIIRPRKKFSHKGTYGHALLVGGKYGMMGAITLASTATLKTGCGLVTAHIPKCGYEIMQISLPEAIISIDSNNDVISEIPELTKYNAIGVGPGLGTDEKSASALHNLLKHTTSPLVIDADAINILALNKEWIKLLPQGTILTPHPKEFERLFGKTQNQYEKWLKQIEYSQLYGIVIILKGAYSSISLPDGTLHINPTGNAGMATAGSGDVLTGIITSLLAQRYTCEESAILGTWIHGKAGDIYAETHSMESLIASSIIENIGNVFKCIHSNSIN